MRLDKFEENPRNGRRRVIGLIKKWGHEVGGTTNMTPVSIRNQRLPRNAEAGAMSRERRFGWNLRRRRGAAVMHCASEKIVSKGEYDGVGAASGRVQASEPVEVQNEAVGVP